MHGDSFATGTHLPSGPLGNNLQLTTLSLGFIGGECATVVFDDQGRLVTVSGGFNGFQLLLLDPDTLEVLARYRLPKRSGDSIFNLRAMLNDTSGGAYFHLDEKYRPALVNAERLLQIFEVTSNDGSLKWKIVKEIDLNPSLPSDAKVTDAIPDWSGLFWFSTRGGIVGTVNRDAGTIQTMTLEGEEIQNALAVSPDGVFVLSDFAIYRFEADPATGVPMWTWRESYDRATAPKPGAITQGSGTTPTLLGDDLVAIADNADERVNICVYLRGKEVTGPRLIVKQPIFGAGQSATESSLVGYGNSLICVNNYGYTTPFDNPRTEPGVVRIDVAEDRASHTVVWQSDEAPQTSLPKLSIGNGLVYIYTRRLETSRCVQAWYLTAIDFRTGETVFKVLAGTGILINNNWGPITIGPNGSAYVGVLNGIIALRDGQPDEPPRTNRRCPRR